MLGAITLIVFSVVILAVLLQFSKIDKKNADITKAKTMLLVIKQEALRHKAIDIDPRKALSLDDRYDIKSSFIRIYNASLQAEKYLEENK